MARGVVIGTSLCLRMARGVVIGTSLCLSVKESRVALQKMVFIKHLVLKSTACGVVIGTSLCLRAQHVKWLLGHPCVNEHGM